jgi:hypothetical protein
MLRGGSIVKQFGRLLRDPKGAPVADATDFAAIGQAQQLALTFASTL